jgi:hypothetical protein
MATVAGPGGEKGVCRSAVWPAVAPAGTGSPRGARVAPLGVGLVIKQSMPVKAHSDRDQPRHRLT